MKEFCITFFGDVCGIVDADVKMYGKSLSSIKNKIRDHANKLGKGIDLIQVYNRTDDKLHEAHIKTLNFHAI